MKYCETCGNELENNDRFCEKCGTAVQQNLSENMSISESEKEAISQGDLMMEKPKKKRKKIIIPCFAVLLVAAIISVMFVLNIPQKYFGDIGAEPSVVTEEATNDNGLRFNFDIWSLQSRSVVALDKLGLKNNQYRWLVAASDTIDENDENLGVYTTYYRYKSDYNCINWWINIWEENDSKKINQFEMCTNIEGNNTSEIEEIMSNNIKISLSMLNPELGIFKIEELAEELENSNNYTAEGYKTLFYNNVCYKIYDNPYKDLYAIVVNPISESKYNELTAGNTAPIEMSDNEFNDKIITLLNDTSFVDDYLPAGSCQDMSYGELIALMFESPDISIERTGNNSCEVTVIGKYRSSPYGPYVFNGNVTITISDVKSGKCSIEGYSGGYDFNEIARGFALSY